MTLFESPKSAYTRALLAALPENAKGGRLPTVSAFAPGAEAQRMTAAPVLETRGITRDYVTGGMFGGARTVRALKGIDLKVERGRTLAVVGESGCGKSTLARIITMIDAPSGGELLIEGERVDIARDGVSRELRRKVQIVFQNPYGSLNPRQKIGDVLAEPLKLNTVAARRASGATGRWRCC